MLKNLYCVNKYHKCKEIRGLRENNPLKNLIKLQKKII